MTSSPSPFDTVIFDLDGTVSDSAPGILASLDHAFNETGYPQPPDLRRFIGPPFETAFRSEGFSPEEITILMKSYRAHYWDIGAFVNTVYPGIEALIDGLIGEGFRIAIGTSKPEPTARRIIEHFGLTDRFDVIGGASFDMSRATKSAVLSYVLEQLGPSRPVMVGDRYHDVEGAAEHRIDCVGVRWGYAVTPDELEKAGARWIVEHPLEISDIVRGQVML